MSRSRPWTPQKQSLNRPPQQPRGPSLDRPNPYHAPLRSSKCGRPRLGTRANSPDPIDCEAGPDVAEALPTCAEWETWRAETAARVNRSLAARMLALRPFRLLLLSLNPDDVGLPVHAPFTLPYAVVAAPRLRRAQSILIMHDFYPDV